jgi:dTDP-4-amino-4,6-dideoxygalactose transaminase
MIPIARPLVGQAEKDAVLAVLDSGMLAQGPRVREFEERFAAYCGTSHAVATSSGTTALQVALLALGIGPGDEVITSPFTFIASGNSILYTGARPVFVDIDPRTYNLNPDRLDAALTPRTRAIMPVHLYGLPAAMAPIMAFAERHGLAVVEDACQAHGAAIGERRAGSFGTGCFSFYGTKNMTTGEGGMITTNDAALAERCRVLRHHGARRQYEHDVLGYNARMTDLQAAIGLVQLGRLDEFNARRIANAAFLSAHLRGVATPTVPDGMRHVFHQYTVRVPGGGRDALLAALKEAGIGSGVYYPIPLHQQPLYRELGYRDVLPEAERAAAETLSLPVHPGLSPADLETIVAAVNAAVPAGVP